MSLICCRPVGMCGAPGIQICSNIFKICGQHYMTRPRTAHMN